MRCTIPEISWHNRDPVLSIDIQRQLPNEDFYRLASGGTDSHVIVWHVRTSEESGVSIEAAADLVRHQKAVNAVRFSPCGKLLASGDDESVIMIWKQRQDTDAPELIGAGDSEVVSKESWIVLKVLRGHLEDVYDLCWSPDSSSIISGSVDNTAIMWDVQKGAKVILSDHKGFVQGVAWDPKGQYVATLSSDRKMRVFSSTSKKLLNRVGKAPLPVPKGHELEGKNVNLFHDDTIQTFFRRLCFSPDGEMIIAPSGVIEATEPGKKASSTTLVFSRRLLSRPVCYLPSLDEYSVCVRCCPVLFELRNLDPSTKPESMFLLPYRIVFAVATACAVVLYDTQQPMPFGYVSNLHYTRLTDLAWSPKGDMLMVSSTDGYCSIITFSPGELGEEYNPKSSVSAPVPSEEVKSATGSEVAMGNDILDSTDGVASIQLSQDSVLGVSLDTSGVHLSQSQGEANETVQDSKLSSGQDIKEPSSKSDCLGEASKKESLSGSQGQPHTPDRNNKHVDTCASDEMDNESNGQAQVADKDFETHRTVASNEESSSGSLSQPPPESSVSDPNRVANTPHKDGEDPQMICQPHTADKMVTPKDSGKKARRVQLITLSSPKSRKKLL